MKDKVSGHFTSLEFVVLNCRMRDLSLHYDTAKIISNYFSKTNEFHFTNYFANISFKILAHIINTSYFDGKEFVILTAKLVINKFTI